MKTIVVTGASAGIGRETARGLAPGARLLVVGRNAERTRETADALRPSAEEVVPLLADFSSLRSVDALAEAILAHVDRVDVLVNNAGLWHQERRESAEGFEDTFAVNHLAPFLLTQRLMPALLRADAARVVTVSSRLHRKAGAFDFEDLQVTKSRYRGLRQYARSKLANVLFSFELARRLADTRVTSNAVHPGSVQTVIVRDNPFLSLGIKLVAPLLKTATQGAATSVHVASSPELEGVTGGYFADERERAASPHAYDRAAAARLWDLSLGMVGLTECHVTPPRPAGRVTE